MFMLHARTKSALEELKNMGKNNVLAEEVVLFLEEKYNTELTQSERNSISLYLSSNYMKERAYLIEISLKDGVPNKKVKRINLYQI